MNPVINMSEVTKRYGDVTALDDVSLSVRENTITGLLGRNGAGKSTLMGLLTGQALPGSGRIEVFGSRPYENESVLSQVSFIKESQRYPDNFRVRHVLRADELRTYRFLGVTFLVLYVFFVVVAGRPYYLGGLYGLVAAAGALGLQRRREAGRRRWSWAAWPAYALSAAAAAGMLMTGTTAATQSGITGSEIAQRTAAAYHALPPDRQQHTAIMGQSYIVAAYIDSHSPRQDLPEAHSANRGYDYFPPPPEHEDAVLYVGANPDKVRSYFTEVRKVAEGGETRACGCAPVSTSPGTRSGHGSGTWTSSDATGRPIGYSELIKRSTRSSTARNGSLHSTVRCA